jgi:hypothetical protein
VGDSHSSVGLHAFRPGPRFEAGREREGGPTGVANSFLGLTVTVTPNNSSAANEFRLTPPQGEDCRFPVSPGSAPGYSSGHALGVCRRMDLVDGAAHE